MKIEANIDKKHFLVLLSAILVLGIGAIGAIAATAPNPGHAGTNVNVDIPGVGEKSLQQAIDAGDFSGSSSGIVVNSLNGKVIITAIDVGGNSERCWYKVEIDGNLVYPDSDCTGVSCPATPSKSEVNNIICHELIYSSLQNVFGKLPLQGIYDEGFGSLGIYEHGTWDESFLSTKLGISIDKFTVYDYTLEGPFAILTPDNATFFLSYTEN